MRNKLATMQLLQNVCRIVFTIFYIHAGTIGSGKYVASYIQVVAIAIQTHLFNLTMIMIMIMIKIQGKGTACEPDQYTEQLNSEFHTS